MPRFIPVGLDDFRQAMDDLFDEMLIGPWCSPAREGDPVVVLDRADAYEVRLFTGDFKPDEMEVQVRGDRLTLQARRGARHRWERVVTLADEVDAEAVTAKWAHRVLTVVLPKRSKRPHSEKE